MVWSYRGSGEYAWRQQSLSPKHYPEPPRPSIYALLEPKCPLIWDHIPLFEGTRRVLACVAPTQEGAQTTWGELAEQADPIRLPSSAHAGAGDYADCTSFAALEGQGFKGLGFVVYNCSVQGFKDLRRGLGAKGLKSTFVPVVV